MPPDEVRSSRTWLALAALAVSACGAPDAAHAMPDVEAPPYDRPTYVLSSMNIETTMPPGSAYGIDLDGRVGGVPGTCTDAIDFTSPITGATGVDNQFSNLFPIIDTLVGARGEDAVIRNGIIAGRIAVVLVVDDLNSYTNDNAVRVRLVMGRIVPGMTLLTDATGTALAPGASFQVGSELGTYPATITNGRLAFTSTAPLPLFVLPQGSSPMPLRNTRFEARITATALYEGQLGGEITVDDVVAWLVDGGAIADRASIEALLRPDLEPDADGAHCAGASAGAEFAGVLASLLES